MGLRGVLSVGLRGVLAPNLSYYQKGTGLVSSHVHVFTLHLHTQASSNEMDIEVLHVLPDYQAQDLFCSSFVTVNELVITTKKVGLQAGL